MECISNIIYHSTCADQRCREVNIMAYIHLWACIYTCGRGVLPPCGLSRRMNMIIALRNHNSRIRDWKGSRL